MQVEGTITLQVTLESYPCAKIIEVNFLVVSIHNNACNAILGRPPLNRIGVIISTLHLLMKFPTNHGIGQV